MKVPNLSIGKIFLVTALVMLVTGLALGVITSMTYLLPDFLKKGLGFVALRPMHVSAVMFWILLGATGCIYSAFSLITKKNVNPKLGILQWFMWTIAISGIFYSYLNKNFGGREYWEFEPFWALPIALAWIIFIINFSTTVRSIKKWPVYIWMWMTGIIFFMFSFIENYLWLFPYFREHLPTDITIQWKVNGSLVGAWNQILYGTAFFIMDRISGNSRTGLNKGAFTMYFLGLTNLMFNWGHHVYTAPTENYVRYVGYAVSMTEWIIFAQIVYNWKSSLTTAQKHFHYFPYRFLIAADIWVFINISQALLMSIPAINIYTHGTHITVAHAMGTTIGINTMILLAACFEFLESKNGKRQSPSKILRSSFWLTQFSLLLFWISLSTAGVKKGLWQMQPNHVPFHDMMNSLLPWFILFAIAGVILAASLSTIAISLLNSFFRTNNNPNYQIKISSETENLND